MKKVLKIIFLVFVAISITACDKDKPKQKENDKPEVIEEKAYYDYLPRPIAKADRVDKNEKTETKIEYVMYVNEYSYEKFYDYIMSLEKVGLHYEFVNDSVPKDINKLHDKTETSWAGNDGKTWIRASWRSKDNTYYTTYNLQVIFNNYDYLLPIVETKAE